MQNFNLDFKKHEPAASDFAEIFTLRYACKQLGIVSAVRGNQGNGNFVVLEKEDGTSTTVRASKELTDAHLSNAMIGRLKELDKDGKPIWIVCRPAEESSVFGKKVYFQ